MLEDHLEAFEIIKKIKGVVQDVEDPLKALEIIQRKYNII